MQILPILSYLASPIDYLKEVISDGKTGIPSSRRFILVTVTLVLCLGFLLCTVALLHGVPVPESIILGLAGILAGLSGSSYISTKRPEILQGNSTQPKE